MPLISIHDDGSAAPAGRRAPVTLLVGASSPAGHVGLSPALRAQASLGCHATTVVTAIRPLVALSRRLVGQQLARALTVAPDAVLVGDPGDDPAGLAEALADALGPGGRAEARPLVIAPNAVSRGRSPRFDPAHLRTLCQRLGPHAEAIVVDGDEAALLTGREVPDRRRMADAAKRIHDAGVRYVVVTGGRAAGHAVDVVFDGEDLTEFGCDRRPVDRQAGAGAVFASLLVGWRARGAGFLDAVDRAKRGVDAALRYATAVGPVSRVEPLGRALHASGVDRWPIEVPADE